MRNKYSVFKALLIVFFLVTTNAAFADQFAYISPQTAEEAVELLQKEAKVYFFCEPCGETKGTFASIDSVEQVDVDYEGYHEVRLNGEGIDLAYTYIRRGKKWSNVAVLLGLEPSDVSAEVTSPP